MTTKQNVAITKIARAALDRIGNHAELKDWVVTHLSRLTFVRVETGRIGDEGTMAAALCRQRGHFIVGKHGGIVSMESTFGKRGRRTNARKYPLIYGFVR